MQLEKSIWTQDDIKEFENYLLTFSKGEQKGKWEQKIANTKLDCIAVDSKIVKDISNKIYKGNFISFVDFWLWNNLTLVYIIGNLICKIDNFDIFKKYLLIYANKVDNWAGCDCLKFKITNNNLDLYLNFAYELIKSKKTFVRRIGLNILFKMLKFKDCVDKVFEVLNGFFEEKEYYVNMMLSWIVCECFIKYRDKTIKFLSNNHLNKFVINKAISKCRDSFSVSKQDKDWLLKFKVK